MKTLMTLTAVFGLSFGGAAFAADPAMGLWKTQPDDGAYAHVQMTQCGTAICGTIERTFKDGAEYASENIGKKIVIDMKPDGAGKYAGQVWRPSNNKIYLGKMTVEGDQLKLSGCVAGGLFCSKQDWTRLP